MKVFYGDASRLDLLRAAGAESARLMVLSIGDHEKTLEIVATVRQHFPEAQDPRARAQPTGGLRPVRRGRRERVSRVARQLAAHGRRRAPPARLPRDAGAPRGADVPPPGRARRARAGAHQRRPKEFFDSASKAVQPSRSCCSARLDGDTAAGDSAWDSESRRREYGRRDRSALHRSAATRSGSRWFRSAAGSAAAARCRRRA